MGLRENLRVKFCWEVIGLQPLRPGPDEEQNRQMDGWHFNINTVTAPVGGAGSIWGGGTKTRDHDKNWTPVRKRNTVY